MECVELQLLLAEQDIAVELRSIGPRLHYNPLDTRVYVSPADLERAVPLMERFRTRTT